MFHARFTGDEDDPGPQFFWSICGQVETGLNLAPLRDVDLEESAARKLTEKAGQE